MTPAENFSAGVFLFFPENGRLHERKCRDARATASITEEKQKGGYS